MFDISIPFLYDVYLKQKTTKIDNTSLKGSSLNLNIQFYGLFFIYKIVANHFFCYNGKIKLRRLDLLYNFNFNSIFYSTLISQVELISK